MTAMMTSVGARFAAFWTCCRAAVASEFALILPLGVVLLVGTSEIGTVLLADRKVTRATHVGADLVAQVTSVTTSDLNDVFDAMEAIMQPLPSGAHLTISSIYHDPDTNAVSVDWSVSRNGGSNSGSFSLPSGLTEKGDSVIVAEVEYDYTPLFRDFILGDITLGDIAYLKPRRTLRVIKN